MSLLNVAFWNLQNLFDTQLSAIAADFDYTPAEGWTDQNKNQKLDNLSAVINSMFGGAGPDLLGICEIENKDIGLELLGRLNNNRLRLAHVDSPDIRGIDCSLIYSLDKFRSVTQSDITEHLVHNRYPTRDIFEVHLEVRNSGAELIVMVNHWPSRSRGRYESEPYRITVANHCGKIIDDLLKVDRQTYLGLNNNQVSRDLLNARWNRNVLVMGDLNDEPYDRSVLEELQASKGLDHLEELVSPGALPRVDRYLRKQAYLFNAMWPYMSQPDQGSYHYGKSVNTMNMLDQIIVSRGLYYGESGLKMVRTLDASVCPE